MRASKTIAAISSGLALASLAGVAAYATLLPESQLLGKTLVSPHGVDQIALTFDDGPNPQATPVLLEVLARHEVHATFFLIGAFVRREPGLVRAIVASGHTIGNHTMTHRRLLFLPEGQIQEELSSCKRALEDAAGVAVRLFRPPFGSRRPAVMRAASELGMKTVLWNLMVGDWKPVHAETLLCRLESGVGRNRRRNRGSNIVLHDGGHAALGQPRLATIKAVDLLLSRCSRKTRFVTPNPWA